MLEYINSKDEWNEMARQHQELKNIIVVCFGAEWCGPCKALQPKLNDLSNNYPNIKFIKVDIEKCPEVADKFNIASVPTTLILKDCSIYKTIVGADILGIQSGLDNILY
jgi:thioredoxin 1